MPDRQQQANDWDECRDRVRDEMYADAKGFQSWLVSHYETALNPVECLTALAAVLYGRLAHSYAELDFELDELAEMFDMAVADVDSAAAVDGTLWVPVSLDPADGDVPVRTSASVGVRSLSWCEYVNAAAADDAHDMVLEKYEGGI